METDRAISKERLADGRLSSGCAQRHARVRRNALSNQKPGGLAHNLPVPKRPLTRRPKARMTAGGDGFLRRRNQEGGAGGLVVTCRTTQRHGSGRRRTVGFVLMDRGRRPDRLVPGSPAVLRHRVRQPHPGRPLGDRGRRGRSGHDCRGRLVHSDAARRIPDHAQRQRRRHGRRPLGRAGTTAGARPRVGASPCRVTVASQGRFAALLDLEAAGWEWHDSA
jgi:hypothetical protein